MTIRMSPKLKNTMLFEGPLLPNLSLGRIQVYSGEQPGVGGELPSGDHLGDITLGGVPWSNGGFDGGLELVPHIPMNRLIKPPTHDWVLTAIASGKAGWWRFLSPTDPDVCIDGAVTVPYNELYLGSPDLVQGSTRTIEIFQLEFYW